MQDLYVVYDGKDTIKCAFFTIVIRNEALTEKYPGGIKAFIEKHGAKCNNEIAVTCHMGDGANDVLNDLIGYGFSKVSDFLSFDAASYILEFSMLKSNKGHLDIGFEAPWLKGQCIEDGAVVWYNKPNGPVALDPKTDTAIASDPVPGLKFKLYHHDYVGQGHIFRRLKRKKWNWQFLASGVVTWNMASSTHQVYNIGHTDDNRFWALQDYNYHRKIVTIAEVMNFEPWHAPEIARRLLVEYDNGGESVLNQMTELGDIPLPIGKERK
jgi:hypothetical protein